MARQPQVTEGSVEQVIHDPIPHTKQKCSLALCRTYAHEGEEQHEEFWLLIPWSFMLTCQTNSVLTFGQTCHLSFIIIINLPFIINEKISHGMSLFIYLFIWLIFFFYEKNTGIVRKSAPPPLIFGPSLTANLSVSWIHGISRTEMLPWLHKKIIFFSLENKDPLLRT